MFWCTPKCTANFNNKIDYDITLASTCICTLILHNSLLFSVICFVFQIPNNIVYIEQSLNLFIYLLIIWRLILSSKAVFIRQLLTGSCISTAEKISQWRVITVILFGRTCAPSLLWKSWIFQEFLLIFQVLTWSTFKSHQIEAQRFGQAVFKLMLASLSSENLKVSGKSLPKINN